MPDLEKNNDQNLNAPPAEDYSTNIQPEEKTTGIITYVTVIGLIIGFIQNSNLKSEYVNFHLRQMLGIACISIGASVIGIIPFIGWLIWIVGIIGAFVMWVMGFMGALNGEKKPVPVLGEKFQEWFASVSA